MESTTATETTVHLDPEQLRYLAEVSQGNTYAVIGLMFAAVAVLVGIFLTTLLR